jgi:hypothetical protein
MKAKSLKIFLITVFLSCGCVLFTPKEVSLKSALPRETDVPGWLIERDHQNISGADIARLDPLLRAYGASEYADVVYREISDEPLIVTVQIVKLSNLLNAFGLFSMERGFVEESEMDSMTQYSRAEGVFFLVDAHYVKLLVNRETSPDKLKSFMDIIRQNLSKDDKQIKYLPDFVNVIPGNILNSDLVYYSEVNEAISGSGSCFVRKRMYGKNERYILFNKMDSRDSAAAKYDRVAASGGFVLIKSKPFSLSGVNPGNHYITIALYRDWFLGYDRADSYKEAENVLSGLTKAIKESESIK